MLPLQDILVFDPVTSFVNSIALALGSTDAVIMT
ncbi:hypothetical protein SAMN05444580_11624 [Rhodococcus tukisamuensis]|uniref:Uncharacterized protein n=1 Tax=Rhodococcus tukisamuensis TaxID=168276 RepID=A0A1G7CHQ3_9NOCA|nr:hypothetical protein SAMN05444580_11624 [Rhodococcus tukisamuensis]